MITLRPGTERGHTKLSWLDSRHTFSFGDYHDQRYMGFRDLRVINEDRVNPGAGFPTHSHRDMEILTYVLEGAVEHKDSTGTRSVIRPGEVQRMSAGTGISHSEYNHSPSEPVHFLQIWILPEQQGLAPGYEQRRFASEKMHRKWCLVASKTGESDTVLVHQDMELYVAQLEPGDQLAYRLKPHRHAWLQVARGTATLNGLLLKAGDGAAVNDEAELQIKASDAAEVLLFDLA